MRQAPAHAEQIGPPAAEAPRAAQMPPSDASVPRSEARLIPDTPAPRAEAGNRAGRTAARAEGAARLGARRRRRGSPIPGSTCASIARARRRQYRARNPGSARWTTPRRTRGGRSRCDAHRCAAALAHRAEHAAVWRHPRPAATAQGLVLPDQRRQPRLGGQARAREAAGHRPRAHAAPREGRPRHRSADAPARRDQLLSASRSTSISGFSKRRNCGMPRGADSSPAVARRRRANRFRA